MPEYHWARPWRRDDLEYWRTLLTAPKLSGPVLTLKLCQWSGRADAERAESAHADGLEHCPPHPWTIIPQNWSEASTSLEHSTEAKRIIIGTSHVSHFLYWPLPDTFLIKIFMSEGLWAFAHSCLWNCWRFSTHNKKNIF